VQHECLIKKTGGERDIHFQTVFWVNLHFPLPHQNTSMLYVCRKFHPAPCKFETAERKDVTLLEQIWETFCPC